MLRSVLTSSTAVSTVFFAPASVAASPLVVAGHGTAARPYRIIPHIDNEIEDLAEVQKSGRWFIAHRPSYCEPMKQSEVMTEKLNNRERRRNGTWPEKSIARRLSQYWAKDGKIQQPNHKTKWMTITVIGFDGHPYHFRVYPLQEMTLNALIDQSGMNHGWSTMWGRCFNVDCSDATHGDGCLVNVDLETLDRLAPPGRWEYFMLTHYRTMNRADVKFNVRFSCQIRLTEELDGGVFAMKQYYSRALREAAADWGEDDNWATIAAFRSKKVEPWAPMIEEPTKRDFPITPALLWAKDYEEVLKHKYPSYKRKDGFHTRPDYWSSYV